MRRLPHACALLLCQLVVAGAHAQCEQNNFLLNGSFTGPEGTQMTAPGWFGLGSPDANDENGPLNTTSGYNWLGTPLASPDGGTWQNICCAVEAVEQILATTAGQAYTLCFEYAAQGIIYIDSSLVYADHACIEVYINGLLSYATPLDTSLFTWEHACMDFTANVPSTSISFATCGGPQVYVAIDGACLNFSVNVGVSEGALSTPQLVPNPALGSCRIMNTRSFDHVVATDARGRISILRAQGDQVDVSSLASGLYTMQCWSSTGPVSAPARLVIAP